MIVEGSRVSIEYTLTMDDGSVADSNVGEEALVYEQGQHEILPALERALAGMSVGDAKDVVIDADEGYGPVDDTLFETVPARVIPENGRYVGAYLVAQAKTGECVVIDVGDNPPEDLGLHIGQRVQVAKYMGSFVELREKWLDPESGDVKLVTHSYITIDASHILNTFEKFEGMHDRG